MLSMKPPILGGSPEEAKLHFEKALQKNQRNFFLAHYYYARYYAVRVQDKKMFMDLIDEVMEKEPSKLKDVCLLNAIMRNRMLRLKDIKEEFFY